MVRGFGKDMVEKLNDLSTKETYPDATFLLDLPVELGLQRRVESGKMDRLDMEGMDFHVKVRDAYLELAKADTHDRWHIIDASQSLEEVQEELWTKVKTVLGI